MGTTTTTIDHASIERKRNILDYVSAKADAKFRSIVTKRFRDAGIAVDGDAPHDIKVHNEKFFRRVAVDGRLGLGESYMDGWWDCPRLDEFTRRVYHSELDGFQEPGKFRDLSRKLQQWLQPDGSRRRSKDVADVHYNLGNDLFEAMLDQRMVYSCPYWDNESDSLDVAQEKKLDLICRKLSLAPGMRVLDVGCGWGSFAKFAASRCGVEVVGVSIAEEQIAYARQNCAGLAVDLRVLDYRDAPSLGAFDRIVSIGMFEHVELAHYRLFFETMHECLKPEGVFLLHTNTLRDSYYSSPWLTKYIFPGGYIPSLGQIAKPLEGVFSIEHVENIGFHYYRAFLTWFANFERNWARLRDKYDERFFRMWKFYLLTVSAGYEARYVHVHQLVLTKPSRCQFYSY